MKRSYGICILKYDFKYSKVKMSWKTEEVLLSSIAQQGFLVLSMLILQGLVHVRQAGNHCATELQSQEQDV
jgi:hypothetical protein